MEFNLDSGDLNRIAATYASIFGDIGPALPDIAQILVSSIETNFEVGGRYGTDNEFGGGANRWIPSKRSLGDTTEDNPGGTTLVDTGRLAGSIVYAIDGTTIRIGTVVQYAAIHQFGGRTGRGGKTVLPPRPFLVVQNEDFAAAEQSLVNYFTRRLSALK